MGHYIVHVYIYIYESIIYSKKGRPLYNFYKGPYLQLNALYMQSRLGDKK